MSGEPRDDWKAQAACKGYPTDDYFPSGGPLTVANRDALIRCVPCPVKRECMDASMGDEGIWGGVVVGQRGIRVLNPCGVCGGQVFHANARVCSVACRQERDRRRPQRPRREASA